MAPFIHWIGKDLNWTVHLLSSSQCYGCRLCWYVVVFLPSVLPFGRKTKYKLTIQVLLLLPWLVLTVAVLVSSAVLLKEHLLLPNRYFGRTWWGTALWSNLEALLALQMSLSRNTGHSIVHVSLHHHHHHLFPHRKETEQVSFLQWSYICNIFLCQTSAHFWCADLSYFLLWIFFRFYM